MSRAQSSSLAPSAAAFFMCARLMPTTSNWAWVTTMRSQPSSRAAAMRASASSGEAWPVCTTRRWAAQILSTARAAGRTLPRSSTMPRVTPGGAVPPGALHMVVGVERREPDHAAEAALHAPHPFDGLRIEPAHRVVERDAAEHLDARHVLADEVRAIGGVGHVVLEDHRFHLARGGQRGELVVVERPAEDVGRRVGVEVDQALDRADRRRGRGVALHAGVGGGTGRGRGGPAVGGAGGSPGSSRRRESDRRGGAHMAAAADEMGHDSRDSTRGLDLMATRRRLVPSRPGG